MSGVAGRAGQAWWEWLFLGVCVVAVTGFGTFLFTAWAFGLLLPDGAGPYPGIVRVYTPGDFPVTAVTAAVPAMNMREARLARADEAAERHWSRGTCWCRAEHQGAGRLTLVAPPWDPARAGEVAR